MLTLTYLTTRQLEECPELTSCSGGLSEGCNASLSFQIFVSTRQNQGNDKLPDISILESMELLPVMKHDAISTL